MWKDTTETILSDAAPGYYDNACGVAVNSKDLYVAGYVGGIACYWKNGIQTRLTGLDVGAAKARAITISGGDVYIAVYEALGGDKVVHWKNGVPVVLSTSDDLVDANAIAVSGKNVSAGGYIGDTAVYWNNSVRTTLAANIATVNGLAVSGSTVYAVATFNNKAVCWTNGTTTVLSTGSSAAYVETMLDYGAATAVTLSGIDIYLTGYAIFVLQDKITAAFWKNRQRTILASSPIELGEPEGATSIVVVK